MHHTNILLKGYAFSNPKFFEYRLSDAEIGEVVDCLKSGRLTTGPRVKQFENNFAEFTKSQHAVAVNSCT